jgi:hypothetical protein
MERERAFRQAALSRTLTFKEMMMNKMKIFGAIAILATAFGTPALAQGHHGGGMVMNGGGGRSFGGGVAGGGMSMNGGGSRSFGGGGAMRSSGNLGTRFAQGSGRNFSQGGWQGERHEGRDGRRGWGEPGVSFGVGYGYGYGYPYGYDSYAAYGGDCYLVRRRVLTPFGWRLHRVQVCD